MVSKNQHFIVTLESSDQFRKELWVSNKGYTLPGKPAWKINAEETGFVLNQDGVPAFGISSEEGKNGVVLPFTSKGRQVQLKIQSVDHAFGWWLNSSTHNTPRAGSDLIILTGSGASLLGTNLVEKRYCGKSPEGELFTIEVLEKTIHFEPENREITATLFGKSIPIIKVASLSLADWNGLELNYHGLWWKFRFVFPHKKMEGSLQKLLFGFGSVLSLCSLLLLPSLISRFSNRHDKVVKFNVTTPTGRLVIEKAPIPLPPIPEIVTEAKPIEVHAPVESAAAKSLRLARREMQRSKAAKNTLEKELAQLRSQMKSFTPDSHTGQKPIHSLSTISTQSAPTLVGQDLAIGAEEKSNTLKINVDVNALPVANPGSIRKFSEEEDSRESLKLAAANVSREPDDKQFVVMGGLTASQVEQAVTKNIDSVRGCYESALLRRGGQQGKVVLSFLIGKTGKVEGARIAESSIPDTDMSKCIVSQTRHWEFPTPSNHETVNVSYPFVFKSIGVN